MRAVIAGALCLLVVTAAALTAVGAACQKVDIKVDNQGSKKIKALKIEYYTSQERRWRTEDFSNTEVPARTTKTVANDQNLQYIEGYNVTKIKLHYKVWCSGKWSGTKTHTDASIASQRCTSNSGKAYRVDLPSSAVSCEPPSYFSPRRLSSGSMPGLAPRKRT
jgi:hypothetical protein